MTRERFKKRKTTDSDLQETALSNASGGEPSAEFVIEDHVKHFESAKRMDRSKDSISQRKMLIVGIGASAGGLEALKGLLANMPVDTGLSFVVVTHQQSGKKSLLPELLQKKTLMKVVEVYDGIPLQANSIYIALPGDFLTVRNGRLLHDKIVTQDSVHLPIDHFFQSLAQDQGRHAICIVLSGTGTDGTQGVKAVKLASGMAMAQQPESASYHGMPRSAIATKMIDYVLSPEAIPRQLLAYVHEMQVMEEKLGEEKWSTETENLDTIFNLLQQRTGHDFSSYKSNTLCRRIDRRMVAKQIDGLAHYVRYLHANTNEIDSLFKELLISVTSFFRDAKAWVSLGKTLKQDIGQRLEKGSFRAWVPACATGEEAFTLSMVLHEIGQELQQRFPIQIFGTDIDTQAIVLARTGKYSSAVLDDVSPERIARFFSIEDGVYRIQPVVRESVIFAEQNVIRDPPFTKLDLISCRNLMIYLKSDLQKQLLPIFHYALKPDGLLFLGHSETIGPYSNLFKPVDKRWKIFRRKQNSGSQLAVPRMPSYVASPKQGTSRLPQNSKKEYPASLSAQVERLLLGRFAPTSVVVTESGDIVHIHGRTGLYLETTPGQARSNIVEMARDGIRAELASAIRRCLTNQMDVVCDDVQVTDNGESAYVQITVTPIQEIESLCGLLLVTFQPTFTRRPVIQHQDGRLDNETEDQESVRKLRHELEYLKQSYRTTLAELEMSNEDLKATNEELQSANEELETSKEEMQSLNEELTTVNSELQSKLDELSQANDDLQNLLNSTDIATIFLDNGMNVKRFTERAKALVSLRQSDVGRPIADLSPNIKNYDLIRDCEIVLKTLVLKEAEIETKNGGRFLMRIMPYRTAEGAIDGLVLTFVNIHQLIQTLEAGQISGAIYAGIFETIRQPLLVLDGALNAVSANRSFYRVFRTSRESTEGASFHELAGGQWNIPKLRMLLESILSSDNQIEDFEVTLSDPDVGKRTFTLNARRLKQSSHAGDLILLSLEDTTKTQ